MARGVVGRGWLETGWGSGAERVCLLLRKAVTERGWAVQPWVEREDMVVLGRGSVGMVQGGSIAIDGERVLLGMQVEDGMMKGGRRVI